MYRKVRIKESDIVASKITKILFDLEMLTAFFRCNKSVFLEQRK